jgi:AcrR family transcriptional regulator
MLIYHFGSRDGLLVAVVRAVEARQREVRAELSGGSPREMALAFWRSLADPALAPYERLFFELYGAALGGQSSVAPVLDGIVTSWLADDSMFAGLSMARARMALAFTRGALLDLLATGDRAAVDEMVVEFVDLVWGSDSGSDSGSVSGPPEEPERGAAHDDDAED